MARLDYGITIMRKQALFGRVEERVWFEDPDTFVALTYASEGVRALMGGAGFEPTPADTLPDGWVPGGRGSYLRLQRRFLELLPEQEIDEHPDDAFQLETFLAALRAATPLRGEVGLPEGRTFGPRRAAWTVAMFILLALFSGGIYLAAENREQVADRPIDAVQTIASESGLADAVDAAGLIDRIRDGAAQILTASDDGGDVPPEAEPPEPETERMRSALQALQDRR